MRPFVNYFVAGGLTTLLAFGLLALFVEFGRWDETLSFAVSYVIASIVQYLLLYYWAFQSTADHKQASIRFVITGLSMLGLKSVIFWLMVEILGIWYLLTQIIITAMSFIVAYIISKLYIFTRD